MMKNSTPPPQKIRLATGHVLIGMLPFLAVYSPKETERFEKEGYPAFPLECVPDEVLDALGGAELAVDAESDALQSERKGYYVKRLFVFYAMGRHSQKAVEWLQRTLPVTYHGLFFISKEFCELL